MEPPNPPSVLACLRAETKVLHQKLETVINLEELTQSRANYISSLQRFLGIWVPLENAVGKGCHQIPQSLDLGLRQRSHLLKRDLQGLGMSPEEIGDLRRASEIPSIRSSADAAGILYVLEGSTLGGQIICKHLSVLEIDRENGAAFFYGHGERTGPMWKQFCQWLEETISDPRDIDMAVASAQETFQLFVDWFSEATHLSLDNL